MNRDNSTFYNVQTEVRETNTKVAISNHPVPYYLQEMHTLDGMKVTIRLITCNDKNQLREFHAHLSEETRYLRYQYFKGNLTESDLDTFCHVDYFNALGLVAEAEKDGQKNIIGVGRYVRLNDPQIAEMAFVVQDSEQRKGIGTQLLRHLSILAWERGIRYFIGELLRENGRMINILRKYDPEMNQLTEGSGCTITLNVEDAKENTPAAWNASTCFIKPPK